ncbi:MAG: cyclophilin-like fold protein [Anaerolineae bacterium]|jgi:hypothetical protein
MRSIKIQAGPVAATATLYDNPTADAIWQALPLTARSNRWGDEIYFEIPVELSPAADARVVMEAGELGYWPVGHAFCLFWGPTPASQGDEIRAYSPVNPFGRLAGDPTAFDAVSDSTEITIEQA